jgi:hypothetical protein
LKSSGLGVKAGIKRELKYYEEFRGKVCGTCYDLFVETVINSLINGKIKKMNKKILSARETRQRKPLKMNIGRKRKATGEKKNVRKTRKPVVKQQ